VGIFRLDALFKPVLVFLGISPLPINALILGEPILPTFLGLFIPLADFFFLTISYSLTSDSGLSSGESFSA
tara:strand:- start:1635 stop:1847 length:213 start_codon:yes stop_codon:yes gene_type:complete